MNSKRSIGVVPGALALALVLPVAEADAAGNAYAYGRNSAIYDYAQVVSVTPNIRYVTVSRPVQECWEETRYYTVDNRPAGGVGATLFGAVVGGVIGHQFGSGRGNDAATVAGTLLGAAIGSDSHRRSHGVRESTQYARPVRRCETNYQSHQEERVESYRVIYNYNGRKYATDTPYDPGDRLRIRVDVRPAP